MGLISMSGKEKRKRKLQERGNMYLMRKELSITESGLRMYN